MKIISPVFLALAVALLWMRFIHEDRRPSIGEWRGPVPTAPAMKTKTSATDGYRGSRRFTTKAADLTEKQKAQLAKKFKERFKPAIAKWCKAYAGRVAFQPEDVTFDKFHSLLGYNMYTFMVNGDTLTIVDAKDGAKVCYMSHAGTLKTLNSIPNSGAAPDLSVPVSRTDIINMVKADTGVEYQPNQVEISPTGAASVMGGGAFVDVGKVMMNGMELMTGTNVSMVFAPGGQLVQYEGPVF